MDANVTLHLIDLKELTLWGIIVLDFINEKGKDLHSILAGKAPAHSLLHEITCTLEVGCGSIPRSSPSSFSSEIRLEPCGWFICGH